jgi:glutathione peroxidase-family protein
MALKTSAVQEFYNLEAHDINGKIVSFSKFEGQVVLIVNTASKCGFTPQFEGLEKLYQKYKDLGLEILGFPCNQFGGQDPAPENKILEFCQINYGVTFPMFAKVNVNGADAHPIFKFLKNQQGGFLSDAIKWNFTKFLISPEGKVLDRYAPTTKPEDIETAIAVLLKK